MLRQFVGCFLIYLLAVFYTQYEQDHDVNKKMIGLLCCVVSIVFFAAPLASLMHVIKVKSTESLPFPIILSTYIVSIQWFLYGYLLGDYFIQIPNLLGCLLSGFQLSLFYIYPAKYSSINV